MSRLGRNIDGPAIPAVKEWEDADGQQSMSRNAVDRPANPLDRSIVLVGLMGAGKSCIGKRLAQHLGLPFVDADREIETAAGCSITDFFEAHGEQAFRDGERRVIARLLGNATHVMATGGGAFMDAQTRNLIKDKAISIWLRAELDQLLKRVSRRNDRPLLKNVDQRAKLSELMEIRYPVYAEADLTVDSADGPPEVTLDRVLLALEPILDPRQVRQG
jgi:shikimate kinase